jgi:hypothetical protein
MYFSATPKPKRFHISILNHPHHLDYHHCRHFQNFIMIIPFLYLFAIIYSVDFDCRGSHLIIYYFFIDNYLIFIL